MGFGLLFVGYIFLIYSISFADLLGYLVMAAASRRLSRYIDGFSKTLRVLYALIAVAAVRSGASLVSFIGKDAAAVLKVTETAESVTAALEILLSVLLYVLMLRAIADIAKEVELSYIEKWARIDLVISLIACALGLFNALSRPVGIDGGADPVLSVIIGAVPIAFNIVIVLLNAALIYTCYMRICLPSEQDVTLPTREEKKRKTLPFSRPLSEDEAEVERLFEEKQAAERRAREEKKKQKRRK